MDHDDRKMFAPIFRGPARSPEAEVCAVLGAYDAGATAATLADALIRSRLAVGVKASVTRRIAEMFAELERAQRIERLPDGRYRVTRGRR
jgi:hypothetical protein